MWMITFASLIAFSAIVSSASDLQSNSVFSSTQLDETPTQDQLMTLVIDELLKIKDKDIKAIKITSAQNLRLVPGSVLFLGTSERNVETVVLYTVSDQYIHVSLKNDLTILSSFPKIDFDQYTFQGLYKPSSQDIRKGTDSPDANLIADFSFYDDQFDQYFVNRELLPFVLSPKSSETNLEDFTGWAIAHQNELRELISLKGALLLRGFPIHNAEDFAKVVRAVIGKELVDYKGEGSRTRIVRGVYTSTEAPADFKIPLHNELSCTLNPVDYICFYCNVEPAPGTGQTLLGRTEDVTTALLQRPHIWNLFDGRTIKYISKHPPAGNFFNQINPTHKTWQQAFETEDRDEVSRICEQKGYEYTWNGDWVEVVRRVPAMGSPDEHFDHPYWFNQAHLYHANPRLRGGWVNHLLANLVYSLPSTRQYDIEFDDGSPIPQEVIYEIYDVLDQNTIKFNWRQGDALLLDNRKTLHGKAPCFGQRSILTTMVQ